MEDFYIVAPFEVVRETGTTLHNTHPIAAGCHAIRVET
jgi:hypothetical protein